MTDTAKAKPRRSTLPAAPVRAEPPPRDGRSFAIDAARLLADEKCTDVVCIDVRGLSQVTDYLVIGTGTSERQMRAVLSHVEDMGGATGNAPFRSHSDDRSTWLLADCVDVVVHLFDPEARSFYDLEMLWGDGPRVGWARPPGTVAPGRGRPAIPRENGKG
ncbi:MAG: ribosome silencing factor [Phycisphaerales bacterium]